MSHYFNPNDAPFSAKHLILQGFVRVDAYFNAKTALRFTEIPHFDKVLYGFTGLRVPGELRAEISRFLRNFTNLGMDLPNHDFGKILLQPLACRRPVVDSKGGDSGRIN